MRQRAIPSELVTTMKLDSGAQLLTRNRKAVDLTQGLRLETTRDGNWRLVAAPNQTGKTSKEQMGLAERP
jgi:hypothetical protein